MKYIDADRFRAEIEKTYKSEIQPWLSGVSATSAIYDYVLPLIDALQQEQQDDLASLINEATNVAKRIVDRNSFYNSLPQNLRDKYTSEAWCEILKALPTMKEQEQPESSKGSSKGKFVFPNFLYARTVDNKTIDVSYAPQSLDAVEYIKNDPTEQPEVDLEKEIRSMWKKCNPTDEGMGVESTYMHIEAFDIIVRHFFNLGLKARNQ